MCRMMATVRQAPGWDVLQEFRGLATHGNVLSGDSCGHGDGWGLAAYAHGEVAFFEKSEESAALDDAGYNTAALALARESLGTTLCHLRKASRGIVSRDNAHPFRHSHYTFCHNGGIRNSGALDTYGLTAQGETDSERFFLNILGRFLTGESSTLADAAEASVRHIHEHHTYTSLCFFLSDGRRLLAYRDFRDRLRDGETDPPATFEKWPGYYTLYSSGSAAAFTSEPLTLLAHDWTLMENGELIEALTDGHMTRRRLK